MSRKATVTQGKHCLKCGAEIERKRRPNGRLESLEVYLERKYCSVVCSTKKEVTHRVTSLRPQCTKQSRNTGEQC